MIPPVAPGQTVTARLMNEIITRINQALDITVASPLEKSNQGGRTQIRVNNGGFSGPFLARITIVDCPATTTTPAPSYTSTTTSTTTTPGPTSSTTPGPTTTSTTPCPCPPCKYGFIELASARCGNGTTGPRSADGTTSYALAVDGKEYEVDDCVLVTQGGPGGWSILHGEPCPTTTPCPTTPAPCPGNCRWEWNTSTKRWVRDTFGCSDGCNCAPPAICLSNDAECGVAFTPCGQSANQLYPPATACFNPNDNHTGTVACYKCVNGGCVPESPSYCPPNMGTLSACLEMCVGSGGGGGGGGGGSGGTTPRPCRGRCVFDRTGRVVASNCSGPDCVCPVPDQYYCVKLSEGVFGCESVPLGGTPANPPCKGPFDTPEQCEEACTCGEDGWVEPPTTTTAAPNCELTERRCVRRPVTTTTTSTTSTTTPPPRYCVIRKCPPQTTFCVPGTELANYDPFYFTIVGPVADCPAECPLPQEPEYVWRCCFYGPFNNKVCQQFCRQDPTCQTVSSDYESIEACQAACISGTTTPPPTTTTTTPPTTTTTPPPTTTTTTPPTTVPPTTTLVPED